MPTFSSTRDPVEFADRISRRRALGITLATLAFLGVQFVARPVFRSDGYTDSGVRAYTWAINAGLLLMLMLPIGGFVWGRRVRQLINDDVSRANARAAAAAGFWIAMPLALALYALSVTRPLSGREVAYLVVTPTTVAVMLVFAWLERRAYTHG